MSALRIRPRRIEGVIVLDLIGRIDINAAILVEMVGNCVHQGYKDILCNLEAVDFVDYMGISVIAIAYKEVTNNHGRIKFVHIPVHLKGIFSIAGIDRAIEIFATEGLAINSFRRDHNIENIKKLHLRRRFRRLSVDIKAELRAKYDKKAPRYNVDILNIGALGAYIYGCDKFKLGNDVVLSLTLRPKKERRELDARVVWLSDKKMQHQFHPGIGVEFRNISSPVQKKLIEFVERNLSFMASE